MHFGAMVGNIVGLYIVLASFITWALLLVRWLGL